MMANLPSKLSVFRAQFDVAWPIWAGGYPSQEEALSTLAQNAADLRVVVEQRIKQLFDVRFDLADLICFQGCHRLISNLWPRSYPPNSISLLIKVEAPDRMLRHSESLDTKISQAIEDIAGLIMTFFRDRMPEARAGANIYDVQARWDLGPALSFLHAGTSSDFPEATQLSAETQRPENKILISYSHQDSKWLTQVQTYLAPLKILHKIEYWDDTKTKPGAKWESEIEEAIKRAEVAILLLSEHSLASDFILRNELPKLLEAAQQGRMLLIPVVLTGVSVQVHPELGKFQPLNPEKPLTEMSRTRRARVLSKLVETVHSRLSRPT